MLTACFALAIPTTASLRSTRICGALARYSRMPARPAPQERLKRCIASGSHSSDSQTQCERLRAIRTELKRRGADALIIPTADAHASEYAAAAYARREFASRFTGSAGTAVITASRALLWTDGRYFAQAERELGSEWELMRGGERDTPPIPKWLATTLPSGAIVAIDPFVHSAHSADRLRETLESAGIDLTHLNPPNPVDVVWDAARPPMPAEPVRLHPTRYAGRDTSAKIAMVRERMRDRGVSHCLLSMLDEVCWLYNIRGADVTHCPVVLSYALVSFDGATLYVDEKKVSDGVRGSLGLQGVQIAPYDRIVPDLGKLSIQEDDLVWLDPSSTSVALRNAVGYAAVCEETPVAMLKAVKNETEVEGMRAAHLRDGAALTQFLCWLQHYVRDGATISEVAAADKLEEFREAQQGFIGTSFGTIAGAGGNGAIIHYSAKKESCAQVSKNEVFLLDSGGQYCDGTTDVTRTVHLGGTPTEHEKHCFTRVLQGHIAIDTAVFPEHTTGLMLDTLARIPLWSMGLDYRHGTGHGVGACLNVHEGPQSISSRISSNKAGLRAGMILSNEPGYYENGRFGIRIENLLCVIEKSTPFEFGGRTYLGFERLTFAPIDKSMIAVHLLSQGEIEWVDEYHRQVWEKVSPLIDDVRCKEWLRKCTFPLEQVRVGASSSV